ncbi:MAG: hypothetical protein JWN52_3490 [Actinomycetia bacterium]|nr:hypothetical protein [Actinomycetes bacterium]
MGSRVAVVWIGLLVIVALVGGGCAYLLVGRHRSTTPEQVAQAYFKAWRNGDLDTMGTLVADPPADFADQHRALSRALGVTAIRLDQGPVVRQGNDGARADFTVTRTLSQGDWSFRSALVLVRRHGDWKVDWSPATLYPGLAAGATWKLQQIQAPASIAVDRAGKPLPGGSTVQAYLPELAGDYGGEEDSTAWAIELLVPGRLKPQQVKVFGRAAGGRLRTTLDGGIQSAADSAVRGAGKPAAIVAVRPSTGEVLAVADTLGGRGAFVGLYPPGSTFKVVTAAALVSGGMSPGSTASCPDSVVTGQRTIRNHDGVKLGTTSLGQAFAQSCNTTFSQLAVEKLGPGKLATQAKLFGFGSTISPGVQAYEGDFPAPQSGAELAEAAIGQGRVQASPLSMALVAGAVADGEWRPPRLLSARLLPNGAASSPHPIPRTLLDALRPMMRAVVTSGTAAAAGMPAGVAGKTGTAEYDNAGHAHAWFIGYQGDFAFAVFVQGGESGPHVAAPLAARFLKAR